MKKDWTYKKLGEVCEIYGRIGFRGYTKGDLVNSPDEGAITLSPSNIVNGEMDFSKCSYITWAKYEESPEIMIFPGDILIVKTASVGKTALVKELPHKATINPQFVVLKNIIENNEYLSYFLKSEIAQKYIWSIAKGAAAQTVSQKNLAEMNIPLPPLSEQSRIVSRLDAAFGEIEGLKAKAEAQLREARALFQAALTQEMKPKQGWEEKTIGEIFKTYAGGTPSKTDKSYYEDGNIPWIRSGEVCRKYITECEMFITEKGMKHSSAKYYPVDTVLVAMYGATAAQVGILKFEATSNQAVCGILPHKDYVPEFVYYWFTNIQKELEGQAQGNAQPNISQEKIKRVLIPTIPLSVQQSIVSRLDALSEKVRELEEMQKKVIAECDALKQALLREVFE